MRAIPMSGARHTPLMIPTFGPTAAPNLSSGSGYHENERPLVQFRRYTAFAAAYADACDILPTLSGNYAHYARSYER